MEWLFCCVVFFVVASLAILSVQLARTKRTPALSPLEQRKKALRAVMEDPALCAPRYSDYRWRACRLDRPATLLWLEAIRACSN